MEALQRQEEIREAIEAGNDALCALNNAERQLDSARTWGIVDMFAGGFISSAVKHSRLDEVQISIEKARNAIRRFSREVEHVPVYTCADFDGLTRFVDIFCDNCFVDMIVQSRINRTRRDIAEAKRRVQDAVNQLTAML